MSLKKTVFHSFNEIMGLGMVINSYKYPKRCIYHIWISLPTKSKLSFIMPLDASYITTEGNTQLVKLRLEESLETKACNFFNT